MSQERIIAYAQAMGSDATDIRDAAHEACHAIEAHAEKWDRDGVHYAVVKKWKRPADQLGAEVRARAVERMVCEHFGAEYDTEEWLGVAALETMKFGLFGLPEGFWLESTERAMKSVNCKKLMEKVLALADNALPEPEPQIEPTFWLKSGKADYAQNYTKTHGVREGDDRSLCGALVDKGTANEGSGINCKRCQKKAEIQAA